MSSRDLLLKIGGTAIASLLGIFIIYKASKNSTPVIDESKYTKAQLLMILEDLRIEYTPFYIHYYHLLTAVHQDYHDRKPLRDQLTIKIQDRLQTKIKEIHAQILQKYLIESEETLHVWISHYLNDPAVKRQIEILDINNDRLFGDSFQPPNFELEFPLSLTKEVYLLILKKVFSSIRHIIYKEIRSIVTQRNEKYITKNEMKNIMHNIDAQSIRDRAFQIYGVPKSTPRQPSHRILQKAHYTYMIDKDFMQQIREIKQSHERYTTAILASDEFPGLEMRDPLDYSEEDEIPKKFGTTWFEHEKDEEVKHVEEQEKYIKMESKRMFDSIMIEKEDLKVESGEKGNDDLLIDSQKQQELIFSQTELVESKVEETIIIKELQQQEKEDANE